MKFNLLGTSGVAPIPRPTCNCEVCNEASIKGIPYKRTGPSLYNYDASLLFDLPEEIKEQLVREKIPSVKRVILTHWHPDHTLGIRVLEQINWNFAENSTYNDPIDVYISKKQYDWFIKYSCGGFLDFYKKRGMINLKFLEHKELLIFENIIIQPILIEKTSGFYYVIEDKKNKTKLVYAPCEYQGFKVDKTTRNVNIFIAHNLFWKDKTISPRKNPPKDEDSFEEMLVHSKEMNAKKIILTHIEETFQLGHDQLKDKMKSKFPNFNIEPGYDGMIIDL